MTAEAIEVESSTENEGRRSGLGAGVGKYGVVCWLRGGSEGK